MAVIGGGAAGIAAARHLHDAGIDCVLLEAKGRLGGRAMTYMAGEFPIDLGCGWLHSADRNPWVKIAERQGYPIDKTPPPWSRISNPVGFPFAEQQAFGVAREAFHERAEMTPLNGADPPLSRFLEPGERWNSLMNAVSTYFSGAELDHVSSQDLRNYEDTEVNWRVAAGYGTVVAGHAMGLNVVLNCEVQTVVWGGRGIRLKTFAGVIETEKVIVTLPTAIIAQQPELFDPALPEKMDAAGGLPLGLADKLFLSLESAEEFDKESRLFGHTDRTATAIYHFRPFGRPLVECYFGGTCADDLEREGPSAFFDFAKAELVGQLGSDFRGRIKPLPMNKWRSDRFARGSYSYAKPGKAQCRVVLTEPVDDKLYFAGEACSKTAFSTAHGAYATGIAAADRIIANRISK
ncbi:MAG: flavin monoamine oxidase family protein [Xanthobacteraceae bacterium]